MGKLRSLIHFVGSLRVATVLLMLLVVMMACATVLESMHGTERAAVEFYNARWFEALLCFLGLNVLLAVVVRYPFGPRQVGFVLTHASMLLIIAGARLRDTSALKAKSSWPRAKPLTTTVYRTTR